MPFWTYSQNNSRGVFDFDADRGISRYVIIEAQDRAEAVRRMDAIISSYPQGPYCSCCGSRWSVEYPTDDGTEVPAIYGVSADQKFRELVPWPEFAGRPIHFIHHLDGRIEASAGRGPLKSGK